MRKLLLVLVVIGLGLTAAAYYFNPLSIFGKPAAREPRREVVDRGDITVKLTATGKTVPKDLRYIGLELPVAKVVWLSPDAEPGKYVTKGTELARLELTVLESQQAEKKLHHARAAVESAEAAELQAKAAVREAEIALEAATKFVNTQKVEVERRLEIYQEAIRTGDKTTTAKELYETAKTGLDLAREKERIAHAGLERALAGVKTAESLKIQANAELKAAEAALNPISVVAPIDGYILEKKVIAGQPVSVQATPILFAMVPRLDDMQVVVTVAESDVVKVLSRKQEAEARGKRMTALVLFDAYPFDVRTNSEVDFEGDVVSVSQVPASLPARPGLPADLASAAGPTQTQYSVTIDNLRPRTPTDATPRPLRAGFTANVDLIVNEVPEALRVPTRALNYTPDKLTPEQTAAIKEKHGTPWNPLWLWENGKPRLIFVRRGESDGQWTQIVETEPKDALTPGVTEVVVEPPPAPKEEGFKVRTF